MLPEISCAIPYRKSELSALLDRFLEMKSSVAIRVTFDPECTFDLV